MKVSIEKLHQLFLDANQQISTDTRKIKTNDLFFCLKGENFNGNLFANKAIELGASYVVVDEPIGETNHQIIEVEDVLSTLQQLANYHRNYLNIPIISLTGSNGKTTTKELIREVLATKYKVTATVGNLNNHIGVPLTLLSMTAETEIGIVEMGANHLREIALLCTIANPNYGYITNFGKAHLEGFGSEEGIVQGKSEMYQYIQNNNGKVFINPTDERHLTQAAHCDKIIIEPNLHPLKALTPFVQLTSNETTIQSNLIGAYNYNNIIAAITIGEYFNVSSLQIKNAIENYIPTNNRSQIIQKEGVEIILDAYNANPTSMKAAIDNMNALKNPLKSVILGDMFELGNESFKEHLNIVQLVQNSNFAHVIFVGENFYQHQNSQSTFYPSFDALKEAQSLPDFKNHILLIKGSRGMALERVLDLF